jgi:hypothetical protein
MERIAFYDFSQQEELSSSSSVLPPEKIEGPKLFIPGGSHSHMSRPMGNLLYCFLTYVEVVHGHVDDCVS